MRVTQDWPDLVQAVFQELGATDVLPLCGGQATVTLEVDKQVC